MCVAEALLRIPDPDTADALIRDKLSSGNWSSASAADWALMLTGTLARWHDAEERTPSDHLQASHRAPRRAGGARRGAPGDAHPRRPVRRRRDDRGGGRACRGAPALPLLLRHARRSRAHCRGRGELPRLRTRARSARSSRPTPSRSSSRRCTLVSRKPSASGCFPSCSPASRELAHLAAERGVGVTLDAEESERLELTLDLFEQLSQEFELGLAVQAYQKRALSVCEWLAGLRRRISVRLVKGAYWDGEIKRAQQLGMPDYPVFTRKSATDVSYVACARTLLSAPGLHLPRLRHAQLPHGRDDPRARRGFRVSEALRHGRRACTTPCSRSTPISPAASTRRSAALPICCPTSCAGCSRTAPTPPSCTRSPTPTSRSKRWSPTRSPRCPSLTQPDPRIPLPRDLYPDRLNSLGWIFPARTFCRI